MHYGTEMTFNFNGSGFEGKTCNYLTIISNRYDFISMFNPSKLKNTGQQLC
jgi:hypothetical protein